MAYSDAKRKELETRKRLGPRLGQTTEPSGLPPVYAGPTVRRRRSDARIARSSHPTRDGRA